MIKAVKGTRDILPPASSAWNHVEAVAREVFRAYNYQEIRTPIFEETALFARGVGEDTDIVSKEMYTFEDRDGSSLTLRPEATASVMRAYIEHRLDQIPGVKKFYYIGPMFRRERPQKGRFRQFYQIGAEAIGSESPVVDAEVIEMVVEILRRAGIEGFHLLHQFGRRFELPPGVPGAAAREARASGSAAVRRLPAPRDHQSAARARLQGSRRTSRIIDTLPSILDHLVTTRAASTSQPCKSHLDARGIAYEVRPRMVRGLDYYMRTTFEITHGALGAQNSVLGGGRYDGLAESLGSQVPAPGIGFSIGEDRLVMSRRRGASGPLQATVDVFLAPLGEAAEQHAGTLAAELRSQGISVERSADRKLKRALEVANKIGARYALILGDDEVARGPIR